MGGANCKSTRTFATCMVLRDKPRPIKVFSSVHISYTMYRYTYSIHVSFVDLDHKSYLGTALHQAAVISTVIGMYMVLGQSTAYIWQAAKCNNDPRNVVHVNGAHSNGGYNSQRLREDIWCPYRHSNICRHTCNVTCTKIDIL